MEFQAEDAQKENTLFEELLKKSTPHFFITPSIIAVNIIVFIVMTISGISLFEPNIEALVNWGANFGPYTINLQWWRLLSSTFIHIGVFHLVFNMWCLWNLGFLAERMFGNVTFLIIYILSGLMGSLGSVFWNPTIVSAGASGAIFGIAGGVVFFLFVGEFSIPQKIIQKNLFSILAFVAYNLFYGFTQNGIDNAAHIGGFLAGVILGVFFERPLPPPEKYSRLRYSSVLFGFTLFLIVGAFLVKMHTKDNYVIKYDRAYKLFEEGKFQQAINEFKKFIDENPGIAESHNTLGIIYLNSGKYGDALRELDKAIELDPNLAPAYYNRGLVNVEKHMFNEAILDFNSAINLKSDFAEAYNFRGIAYAENGLFDKAVADYNKTIEINRELVDAYFYKALAYEEMGQAREALRLCNFFLENATPQNSTQLDQAKLKLKEIEEIIAEKISICAIILSTKERAKEIMMKLDSGQDFGKLAKQYSMGPGKDKNGFMGYFAPGDMMPELDKVSMKLLVEEYSRVIETKQGFFILKRIE